MRDWESNHQGVEAPRPQVFMQKDTQRGIKLQTTPRYGAEHGEGEADSQGAGGRRTRSHHPGPAGDWAAGQCRQGGIGRADGGIRQREEGIPGR